MDDGFVFVRPFHPAKGKMADRKPSDRDPIPPGYKLIFRPYITTKDGKRVYPKSGKVFPILVKE